MPIWTMTPGTGDLDLQGGALNNLLIKGRPWEDVRAHGAVGDGVTDDGSAWNTTRAALPSTGGTVLVSPGSYKLTTAFTFASQTNVTVLLMPGVSLSGSALPAQTATNRIMDFRHGWGPIASDGIQYASPNGDDTRDGLSWGSAKKTILAAYDALPSAGGVIYFAQNTTVGNEVSNQGLWLVGPTDPNYGSPLTGWRQQKKLALIGIGGQEAGAFEPVPQVQLIAGSGTDTTKPTIWCAGTNVPLSFQNIRIQYPAVAIRLGVASNNPANRAVSTTTIQFYNVSASLNQTASNGPCMDIGYVFWLWCEHCTFADNGTNSDVDNRCAVLVKPSGPSSGLLHFNETNFSGRAIRYYKGNTSWSLRVRNSVSENVPAGGIGIDLVDVNDSGGAFLEGFEIADAGVGAKTVSVPATLVPSTITAIGTPISGPATYLSYNPGTGGLQALQGLRSVGFWKGRVAGQQDSNRRAFGPSVVRFVNLAPHDTSLWDAKLGPASVTTGITAPDGTAGAAQLASGSGIGNKQIVRQNRTLVVGDWMIGGVWVQGATPAAGLKDVPFLQLLGTGNTFGVYDDDIFPFDLPLLGDGEWEWVAVGAKIATVGSSPNTIIFALQCRDTNPVNYYAPILLHIPTGTISDNEALELTQHLHSWSDDAQAVVGDIATLMTQQLNALGGLKTGMISPAQITADQNDYNPSSLSVWRLSSSAARNITGLAGGTAGRLLTIINIGGQNIVLQNQNAGSAAANRIITGTGADVTLGSDDTATLIYDGTTLRWRITNTY